MDSAKKVDRISKKSEREKKTKSVHLKWTAKKTEMAVQNDKVNGGKNRAAARAQIMSKVNPLRLSDGVQKKRCEALGISYRNIKKMLKSDP